MSAKKFKNTKEKELEKKDYDLYADYIRDGAARLFGFVHQNKIHMWFVAPKRLVKS